MGILDFLVCALATHQAVSIYRYSPLFARVRQWQETGCYSRFLAASQREFLEQLLGCAWCLSVHVALWVSLAYFALDLTPRSLVFAPALILSGVLRLVVITLAVSQAANTFHRVAGMPYKSSPQ